MSKAEEMRGVTRSAEKKKKEAQLEKERLEEEKRREELEQFRAKEAPKHMTAINKQIEKAACDGKSGITYRLGNGHMLREAYVLEGMLRFDGFDATSSAPSYHDPEYGFEQTTWINISWKGNT